MPLPSAAEKGNDVNQLTNTVNMLAAQLGSSVIRNHTGTLSVGTVSPDDGFTGSITEIDFTLGTAPSGSAAVFDVLISQNGGTSYTSATGGVGIAIAAGQTAASFLPAGGIASQGNSRVRFSVLQTDTGATAANLTTTVTTSSI